MRNDGLRIEGLTIATLGAHPLMLVEGVGLEVRRGRILALVGASGSGKSLTCAGALDVLPAGVRRLSGRVLLDGEEQALAGLKGRHVASIMQNPRSAFNPVRTMRAHGVETLKALGRHDRRSEAVLLQALEGVGLEDPGRVLGLHAFEMSGGMLQRMMIALALLTEAPFLFADEPTTDLDLVVQARVLSLLEGVVAERGLGLLIVTHDMGVVARLADDVAVMAQGRIVESGPVGEIFHRPRHDATRALVAAHLSLYGLEGVA
ncbi:nickel import ATP-binding protein NikD [Rhodospirillum rubrum]|uniref:Nickel import ATP-binding protein NikD n=1 Tax=Rhodospirillum rubrum (strain ATCC 11170 / ATH 1.1.1 / DSM 467 / LMG 4362 / NCIMB 8255 / S1) TaxID=269796 RepID=NIKD_RHORT|nr:nickel import ATP-binding protein NikD [Rhodospirillum rubrum]Q2RS21.1 RecName: Full=Nickel import ATP-binding protein NikD [Rhodospirillum rubrum ATCC 11170]ABC23074.1 ABC transporter component [Rhodospirillum rubrum ATCC 11170]AEO48803.1 nickel transporter ATP-binding protein NikD [Rhodospirillum rubrum F11]MBK5954701.1 nickel import ATP-binding protein NikD [Rhodospirillum rubrum]QXG79057.1 nickel import ATP-binding protein NikD [Rhodospirillum rubrum]HAP99124.1 nickel import ATP-bindin